jgi:translation initiation factor 2 alpha subunit (eIF-2alpha)
MIDQYIERSGKDLELLEYGLTREITEDAKGVDPKTRDSSARATYVVNKLVVKVLKNMSKKLQIPRDLLVDLALKRMRERRERKTDVDRHNRERASEILDHFDRSVATEVESELQEILGDDDPILSRFGLIMVIISNLCSAIEHSLNEGTPIDPDDFSQSG